MKTQAHCQTLETRRGLSRIVTAVAVLVAGLVLVATSPAQAGHRYKLAEALELNGFETLKFALDTTGLTEVLNSNRVTLFAPTNDVFEDTAQALGCSDALDLATRLINIPVGDSNALVAVLSHHAVLTKLKSNTRLLSSSPLQTANGDTVMTGVNADGLYVLGAANATPASITVDGINGPRWIIYPIDTILLPFAPPADLCS